MQLMKDFSDVFDFLTDTQPRTVAAVWPHDAHTLEAVESSLTRGLARFIMIGDPSCKPMSELVRRFPAQTEIIEAADADSAAALAVDAVKSAHADVLMKGLINTDNLLRAVLNKQSGILSTGAVLSHVTVCEMTRLQRLLLYSDAAVIPFPTVEQHSAMVGYLASVGRALGINAPKIALIHCNEKTSPKFPVTEGYAVIKERAANGCYGGATVDGPMDVKTAFDSRSAQIKGIASDVAGHADALLFPDIEAANTFYKTVSFFGQLNAGMLMGAQAPVVLPSRADTPYSKMCSLALACLYSSHH